MPTAQKKTEINSVLIHNENAYQKLGFGAQRKYPNEELCRFMGRNYFGIEPEKRKSIRILELGCGSGANLWMLAKEGFNTCGIDLSPSAIPLAEKMLTHYSASADLRVADMTDLPFEDGYFDCVIDIFSSYCINEEGFSKLLSETSRVLKPGGKFFIYTPGKQSDAWKNFAPASKIDESTLNGISREDSAYSPSPHPFRFISHEELEENLKHHNMDLEYAETVSRTYRRGAEFFEFIVAEASRKNH